MTGVSSESSGSVVESQFELPLKSLDFDGDNWNASCVFCDEIVTRWHKVLAENAFRIHARMEHWWGPSEKYLNASDMAVVREQRRRYREVMGSDLNTRRMNAEGL